MPEPNFHQYHPQQQQQFNAYQPIPCIPNAPIRQHNPFQYHTSRCNVFQPNSLLPPQYPIYPNVPYFHQQYGNFQPGWYQSATLQPPPMQSLPYYHQYPPQIGLHQQNFQTQYIPFQNTQNPSTRDFFHHSEHATTSGLAQAVQEKHAHFGQIIVKNEHETNKKANVTEIKKEVTRPILKPVNRNAQKAKNSNSQNLNKVENDPKVSKRYIDLRFYKVYYETLFFIKIFINVYFVAIRKRE